MMMIMMMMIFFASTALCIVGSSDLPPIKYALSSDEKN